MKNVISISLGSSSQDFEFTTRFLGQQLHVRRLGTDGSMAKAVKLLQALGASRPTRSAWAW